MHAPGFPVASMTSYLKLYFFLMAASMGWKISFGMHAKATVDVFIGINRVLLKVKLIELIRGSIEVSSLVLFPWLGLFIAISQIRRVRLFLGALLSHPGRRLRIDPFYCH